MNTIERLIRSTGWLVVFCLLVAVQPALSQSNSADSEKYWIFLAGRETLSDQQASELSFSGAEIVHRSRWLNAVSARIHSNNLSSIEALPYVERLKRVAMFRRSNRPTSNTTFFHTVTSQRLIPYTSSYNSSSDFGTSLTQLQVANVLPNLEQGITGVGVKLGIIDTGIGALDNPAFADINESGRLIESRDFTGVPDDGNRHAEYVLSVAAGFLDGELVGPAHGADIYHARTEVTTSETRQEEDNLVAALEWMVSEGVDVINISLSYTDFDLGYEDYVYSDMDGETAVTSLAVDRAVDEGVVVVVAAGNHASFPSDPRPCPPSKCWYYVGSPADAFNIITVGATTPRDEKAAFSAFGPTFDGRTKPDISAMGTSITYARSSLNAGCNGVVCTTGNGTSFSAPMAAGVVAQMLQVNQWLTPTEVKEILKQTARHPTTGNAAEAEFPNDSLGWGIVDAAAAVAMATSLEERKEISATTLFSEPYPNPARDRVQFYSKSVIGVDHVQVALFDLLGRRVRSRVVNTTNDNARSIELNTAELSSGVYVYQIVTGAEYQTGKLIIAD